MHFSTGQIVFLLFFVVVFVAALGWSFLRDKTVNQKYYKGSWKILVIFLIVVVSLSMIIRLSGK